METATKIRQITDKIVKLYEEEFQSGSSLEYDVKVTPNKPVFIARYSALDLSMADIERLKDIMQGVSEHSYRTSVTALRNLEGRKTGKKYCIHLRAKGTYKPSSLWIFPNEKQKSELETSSVRKFLSNYHNWNIELRIDDPPSTSDNARFALMLDSTIRNPGQDKASVLYKMNKLLVKLEIGDAKWEDVGGLDHVIEELRWSIEVPIVNPGVSGYLGIKKPSGILLTGPPGDGTSLIARVLANEMDINFLPLPLLELFSCYHTETEKNIEKFFNKAASLSQDTGRSTVIFCDEIERFMLNRQVLQRFIWDYDIVNSFIREMSSVKEKRDVVVIGATNAPWLIDPTFYRPGRMEKIILVPPPDEKARLSILKIHSRELPLIDVDMEDIARGTNGYSGSHLKGLCEEAAKNAARRIFGTPDKMLKANLNQLHGNQGIIHKDFIEGMQTLSVDTQFQKIWMDSYNQWVKQVSSKMYIG
jgi:AAA+ superfamily predicted ATPase